VININCENINQAYPWLCNAALDHTRMIPTVGEAPARWAFTSPVCLTIRNPTQLVEFHPRVFGNPFKKFKALFRENHWEFEQWEGDDVSHGLTTLNENKSVEEFFLDGMIVEACFMWLRLCHHLGKRPGPLRLILTQPFFFLDPIPEPDNPDLATIYTQLHTRHQFSTTPKIWDQDASIYRENPMTVGFRESWFRKIATPMAAAGMSVEDRNFDTALEILHQMPKGDDWRAAAEHFVNMEREKNDRTDKS